MSLLSVVVGRRARFVRSLSSIKDVFLIVPNRTQQRYTSIMFTIQPLFISCAQKAPKGRKRKSKDSEESPHDQEIKRLKVRCQCMTTSAKLNLQCTQTFVTACGVRKIWTKEFKDIEDNKPAQIRRIKSILAELGMTGRLSMEKAKSIRAKRELAQELGASPGRVVDCPIVDMPNQRMSRTSSRRLLAGLVGVIDQRQQKRKRRKHQMRRKPHQSVGLRMQEPVSWRSWATRAMTTNQRLHLLITSTLCPSLRIFLLIGHCVYLKFLIANSWLSDSASA